MEKFHPAIVHFPIAFLLLAGLFAFISLFVSRVFWNDLAGKCLVIGLVFTPLAVLSGLIAEKNLIHSEAIHIILGKHKLNGFIILSVFSILTLWHWTRRNLMKKREYTAWVITLLIGSSLVFFQGHWGGQMVFDEGAGVKPMEIHLESKLKNNHIHDAKNVENHDKMRMPTGTHSADTGMTMKDHNGQKMEKDKDLKKDTITTEKKLKNMKY